MNLLEKSDSIPSLLGLSEHPTAGSNILLYQYLYAKNIHHLDPKNPRGLEKLATSLFGLRDYENALSNANKCLELQYKETGDKIKSNMLYIKALSLFKLHKLDQVPEPAQKALSIFMQNKETDKVNLVRKLLEEDLPHAHDNPYVKAASQKSEECLKVKKFLEMKELPDVPGKMVYVLPADWLEKWKEYNNYSEYVGEEKTRNFMEEEVEKVEWLGPIDPTNLLVDEPALVDPEEQELYSNFQLKPDLEENKDFFLINEEFWHYLEHKYGGVPIQRPTYRKSEESMSISVEAWLQKVNVLILPFPRSNQPKTISKIDTIYISKTKNIKDLNEKLKRAYGGIFHTYDFDAKESRIWKVDPRYDYAYAWTKWNPEVEIMFEVQGTILKDEMTIEDAELSNEDTIIFESHFLKEKWFISDDILKMKAKSKESSMVLAFNNIKDFPSGSKKGLTGLQNLGNTCFMNSAIQCLSNTFDLTTFFLTDEYKNDINKYNPLGSAGKLAFNYSQLQKDMWLGNTSYVSPWELKKTIGRLASQFVGYGQQDSQELLSYLLDGLHEDLNRVINKPFFESKDDDDRPDDIVANESWDNHVKRNQSRIQELMHGQFKSRLDCPDCKKISITFDPFMMVSLPIPTVEYTKFFLYFVFNAYDRVPIKISFNLQNDTSYEEILDKLSTITNVDKNNIVMGLLKEHKLIEYVDYSADAKYIKEHEGILFAYEIAPNLFASNRKAVSSKANGSTEVSQVDSTQDETLGDRSGKMETENPDSVPLPTILARCYVQAEPKAFYESEKTVSYTRLIRVEPNDTFKDLHLKIFHRMRHHIYKYLAKQNMKNPINLEENDRNVVEQEYMQLFSDENDTPIYKLWMVNVTKEDPKTGKKLPCEICQKAKCNRCALPYESFKVSDYLARMRLQRKDLLMELKLSSKTTKIELMELNQCKEYKNEGNDDTNVNRNYNIYDCLNLFTRKEKLEKDNAWYCSKCKGHKEALKKMEIYRVPPVLILHLKRFKTSKASTFGSFWGSGKKITNNIDFPVEGLDLSTYVLGEDRDSAIYDLYAVSNHYGGLSGGHYTAYAKNPLDGRWYDFNDSRVSSVSEKEIVGAAAYVLFYKRRGTGSQK